MKYKEALESIKASYDKNENHVEILEYMKKNSSETTDKVTFKEALCDKKHCISLYVLIA